MTTDKELLELAARAAGIRKDERGGFISDKYLPINFNPLEDDGDAFRLVVKLELNVEYNHRWAAARAFSNLDNHLVKEHWVKTENLNQYAATRKAIVIAAAEIGRAMGEKEEQ